AFHTYYLTELFSRLGEHCKDPSCQAVVQGIKHRTSMYFLPLNVLLFVIAAIFSIVYLHDQYANNAIDPVVTAEEAPPEQLLQLSKLLTDERDPARPAIVVVGSGGGTRAAMYTASVLNGLHGLGVDRDIVLLSGVSGGGVALAYF